MHTLENFSPQCLNFQNIPMNTASSSSEAEFFDHSKRQTKAIASTLTVADTSPALTVVGSTNG